MELEVVVNGALQENCYLLTDRESGEALVVDPGSPLPELITTLQKMGMKQLKYILLTHGHYDHILGVAYLKERFPEAKVLISKPDTIFLEDARYSGADPALQVPVTPDEQVGEGSKIPFAGKSIMVLSTPGHTKGSVCYLLEDLMFSGDTLFYKTYGRTDLYSGNLQDMKRSLYKLGALPDDYTVLPGHGPKTSLDYERTHNRMMRKMTW
ncbi:MAG TPA: MBL fold metallo-hydrolase [Clostridiales bacterium]|nr:MBL fold metallo-hydrolase [Clostridiales bacterium]